MLVSRAVLCAYITHDAAGPARRGAMLAGAGVVARRDEQRRTEASLLSLFSRQRMIF